MKLYFEAYGCSLNKGEGSLLRESAKHAGYALVDTPEEADALIISTCIVIEATENKMLRRIAELSAKKKPLIVAGCVSTVFPEKVVAINPRALFLRPGELEIGAALKMPSDAGSGKTGVPPIRTGRIARPIAASKTPGDCPDGRKRLRASAKWRPEDVAANIPIATGCLGDCAYCVTRIARGRLSSRTEKDVLYSIKRALALGKKEIRLCAQDSSVYGRDIGGTLPGLIKKVCGHDWDFRLRVGMMNPNAALPIIDSIIDAYRDEKVFKFVHIPVQSGSDNILKAMGRMYSADDFRVAVKKFRRAFPRIRLSTDIIVAFPGEGMRDFDETKKLLKEVKPNIINIKRFSPRPKTRAYELNKKCRVQSVVAKRRSSELAKLHVEIARALNSMHVGKNMRVLLTERVKRGTTLGRSDNYMPVVVRGEMPLGEYSEVRIKKSTHAYLYAECIK